MSHAWMPFYIGDYLADTGHLTTLEHGAYLMLIMHYWQKGCLPADEKLIARVARLTPEQWTESRDVLAMLFGDGWTHKRIDAELTKATEIVEKRKAAADAGHRKRKPAASAVHVQSICTDTGASTFHQETSSDANASDAAASADPRDVLWREGVITLKAMTGATDAAARSLIGKWVKAARDDCSLVLSKLNTAQAERIGEPVAWITAALRPPDKPPPEPRNAGERARLKLNGTIPHEQPRIPGSLDSGDGQRQIEGPGLARRFAVTPDILGAIR